MADPPPLPVDVTAALTTLTLMVIAGVVIWMIMGKGAGLIELGAPAMSRASIARRKSNQWARPSKTPRPSETHPDEKPTARIQEARANSQISFEDLQRAAEDLRRSGERWQDEDFPAGDQSLFQDPANPPADWLREGERGKPIRDAVISWKSPADFSKTRRPTGKNVKGERTWLYADHDEDNVASSMDVDPDKICQGSLGDCYLLSALASVTRSMVVADDLIDEVFEDVGMYGVSFWVQGRWEMVWVDEKFPCYRPKKSSHSGRWRLIFASSEDQTEIWPIVAEKAYAKLHGSYEDLIGGHVTDALVALTGGHGASMNLLSPLCSEIKVWNALKDAGAEYKDGFRFVGAGSQGFMKESIAQGIIAGHAYTVQDAVCVDGKRLLKLRNPWNRSEWQGDWSDGSHCWKTEIGRALDKAIGNRTSGDDGEFWMSIKDFMKRFQTLDFCDLKIEGREARIKALKEAVMEAGSGTSASHNGVKTDNNKPKDDRPIDDLIAFIEGDDPPKRKNKKNH